MANRQPIGKRILEYLFQVLFFGIISYICGEVYFTVPGIETINTNLIEIPLLISLFHIKKPWLLIGICFIPCLDSPSFAAFNGMYSAHLISLVISWIIFSQLNKLDFPRKRSIIISFLWFLYVFIYYYLFLIPFSICSSYFFGLYQDKSFTDFYSELYHTVRVEIIASSVITAMYLLQHILRLTLKNYKENLETLVQKRTVELSNSIEELKTTQNHLVQSEKMASLGTLTAGIAHEINNPLNYISGGISILTDINEEKTLHLSEKLQKRYNMAFNMIDTGLQRATGIVQALMTFSYRGTPVLRNMDIHEITENTILFLNYKIPQEIEIKRDFRLTKKIPVFAEKMHQVIMNILENAIFELKIIDCSTKLITISTYEQNNNAYLEISNTGKKIPETHLPRIFDPFYTTKDPGKGTGLGLSICYTLIQEHNGTISAKNTETGVCFTIKLPMEK